MMESIPRVDILGVGVSAINMALAVAEIESWIARKEQHYVCVTGVHGVMECQRDAQLMAIHNNSGLTTPDGMPMVWAGRWSGARSMDRVYGPDLMLELCRRAQHQGWRSYFYGGNEGVPQLLSRRLRERFPRLQIAGTYSPPFRPLTPEEDHEVVRAINTAQPDLLWIGLSTPKQERWMHEHIGRVKATVMLGVGAAFDIHAGLLKQAPRFLQRAGLEWLFRMCCEPRRLWRRYCTNNPRFVLALLGQRPFQRKSVEC